MEKINYEKYDNKTAWKYRDDIYSVVKKLGYTYMSEAIHKEYIKLQSTRLVGALFGYCGNFALAHLHKMGATVNGKGCDSTKFKTT